MPFKTVIKIKKQLHDIASQEIAAHSQKFFKTGKGQYGHGDFFLGIRVPILRKLVKQFSSATLADATELLQSRFHEERLLALLMLVQQFKTGSPPNRHAIFTLYLNNTRLINNWDLVDSSAEHIVGAYLYKLDKIPLYKLAKSTSLWERRIAMIATFYYIKKNEFDDALAISEILCFDEHDLIHKAVGWMLREIGKRDLKKEEDFLRPHYKTMPRTMLRYAIEKFPEVRRQKYLKGTIS